jgi:hypothetical protein
MINDLMTCVEDGDIVSEVRSACCIGGRIGVNGCCGEEEGICFLPGIELQFLGRPPRSVVALPTELFALVLREMCKLCCGCTVLPLRRFQSGSSQ